MSFTVKAQQGGVTAAGTSLRVVVLRGAADGSLQGSAGSAGTATQNGAAAHEASVTTTVTGSVVYGAAWVNSASTFTADAQTTMIDNIHEADGLTHGTLKASSATGTPGATNYGTTAPTTNGSLALLEILPAGTITQDASGPAFVYQNTGTSATSASFQPPPGALIIALVSSNGGAGVTSMALSDTSGTGMTWTEGAKINPSSNAYAGVWFAQYPAGPAFQPLVAPSLAAIQAATW